MQTNSRFFDDISKLMTNAMGVAQGARSEAETAMKSWVDRWMADRDFVTREEFDAARAMAQKAREENDALSLRIAALEAASVQSGTTQSGAAQTGTTPSGATRSGTTPSGASAAPKPGKQPKV